MVMAVRAVLGFDEGFPGLVCGGEGSGFRGLELVTEGLRFRVVGFVVQGIRVLGPRVRPELTEQDLLLMPNSPMLPQSFMQVLHTPRIEGGRHPGLRGIPSLVAD